MRVVQDIKFGDLIGKIKTLDIPAESMVHVIIESRGEETEFVRSEAADVRALNALFGIWSDRNVDARDLREHAWQREL